MDTREAHGDAFSVRGNAARSATMNDLIYLGVMLVCLALTFGLIWVCGALSPGEAQSETGSKP